MCVQIDQSTVVEQIRKAGSNVSPDATSGDLNKEFLGQKAAVKLDGPPASVDDIPAGKIVVADMSNYRNIHIVSGPSDLAHLKGFQADYYLVDKLAIAGLYS